MQVCVNLRTGFLGFPSFTSQKAFLSVTECEAGVGRIAEGQNCHPRSRLTTVPRTHMHCMGGGGGCGGCVDDES